MAVWDNIKAAGIRAEMDARDEKLGYRIREVQMDKVPYMFIVGEKEQANNTISVRQRDADVSKQDIGEMQLDKLIELLISTEK